METEFRIKANDATIFVETFDDGVWLSLKVQGGSTHTVLTKEQAIEVMEAIRSIVGAV